MAQDYEYVYRDTVEFINCIIDDYPLCGSILDIIKNGDTTIELKRRQLDKMIDESWVSAIEQGLYALDAVIRTPSRDIKEVEDVLPIELSHNINSRSIRHLAQHTDYISSIEGDVITPSKILNIYRDEDLETYENKFINTLIDRLYIFVDRRYEKMLQYGNDETSSKMSFKTDFSSDRAQAKISFDIELIKKNDQPEPGAGASAANLWERTVNIRNIIAGYMNGSFVKSMNGKFVRPPIIRTNAIMQNKFLRQCLDLWTFIESYDKVGYEIKVSETAEKPDEEYLASLYSTLVLQYISFKHSVEGELEQENILEERRSEGIKPRLITEFEQQDVDEYNVIDVQRQKIMKYSRPSRRRLTGDELKIRSELEQALALNRRIIEQQQRAEREAERAAAAEAALRERQRQQKLREEQRERQRIERAKMHSKKQRRQKKKQSREDN